MRTYLLVCRSKTRLPKWGLLDGSPAQFGREWLPILGLAARALFYLAPYRTTSTIELDRRLILQAGKPRQRLRFLVEQ
jgi:hypothetical protein